MENAYAEATSVTVTVTVTLALWDAEPGCRQCTCRAGLASEHCPK